MSQNNWPVGRSSSIAEQAALAKLAAFEGALTEAELDELESRLILTAAVFGWTGDPLRQPPTVVLAKVEAILGERIVPQSA